MIATDELRENSALKPDGISAIFSRKTEITGKTNHVNAETQPR